MLVNESFCLEGELGGENESQIMVCRVKVVPS
jgi:hypothetical protein